MNLDGIFDKNKEWVANRLAADGDYFNKLSQPQRPDILYIGCSDSRVTAEELMGAEPGEVFVHRNIANMITSGDLSAMSVINFAVSHLKVSHIIVCGHYSCGGVKAALQPADMGILNSWLRNIRDVYRIHKDELDAITDQEHRYRRLVELNVQEQCVNVMKTAEVQKAYKEKKLMLHGWVFDIYSGELIDLKIDFDKILNEIMQIYRICYTKS
jgi:carbonic anhydrase